MDRKKGNYTCLFFVFYYITLVHFFSIHPVVDFKAVLKRKIKEKEREYTTLMRNMAAAQLPADVVTDIAQRMSEIKAEIVALQNTEPPKDLYR